ncbi:Trichoplein keratin filament-binding protein [Gryllus bimaculatus]|nr:Trichoplein keratin filament-binding protein [Gryllus bimaculatus]
MARVAEEREREARRRQQQALGRFLARQAALRLRQRARAVHEALQHDESALQQVLRALDDERGAALESRQRLRADALAAVQQLRAQRDRERLRQADLDFLFEEEARRRWDELETVWKAEEEARNKLIAQVLQTQQQQKALVASVEAAYAELREEEAAKLKAKELQRTELDLQVKQKQLLQAESAVEERKAAEEEAEKLRQEEEKLQQELARMQVEGYRPQSVGRRRLLW